MIDTLRGTAFFAESGRFKRVNLPSRQIRLTRFVLAFLFILPLPDKQLRELGSGPQRELPLEHEEDSRRSHRRRLVS